jgi:hypothetical protein
MNKTSLKSVAILGLMVGLIMTACNVPAKLVEQEKDFDFGKVDNGLYKNTFFDLTIPVPATWHVAKKQTDDLMEGQDTIINGVKQQKKLKAADISTANLLSLFEFQEDTDVSNASMMVLAEKLSVISPTKSGKDYLEVVRGLLKKSDQKYKMEDKIVAEKIGGVDFDVLHTKVETGEVTIYQDYCCAVMKRFSMNFIFSWQSEEQKAELDKLKASAKFATAK